MFSLVNKSSKIIHSAVASVAILCLFVAGFPGSASAAVDLSSMRGSVAQKCAAVSGNGSGNNVKNILDSLSTDEEKRQFSNILRNLQNACSMNQSNQQQAAAKLAGICAAGSTDLGKRILTIGNTNTYTAGSNPDTDNCNNVLRGDSAVARLANANSPLQKLKNDALGECALGTNKKTECINAVNACDSIQSRGAVNYRKCLNRAVAQTKDTTDILNRTAALRVCDIAVQKAKCVDAVKACTNDSCINKVERNYKTKAVLGVCRDRPNPQNCHQRVATACRGKTGEERNTCREEQATLPDRAQSLLNAQLERGDTCGEEGRSFDTQINFGCRGEGNAILDLMYSLIRFASYAVGLILAAAIIYAGIQYSTSGGSPEATTAAKQRIQNVVIGLIFYLFIFALVQYLVPGGIF